MPAPETQAREALMSRMTTLFTSVEVRSDRLHASLGDEFAVIGCYPERSVHEARNHYVNEYQFAVQFFNKYELQVDRQQSVDPAIIENLAEEFRKMIEDADPQTASVWYFELNRLEYPPDPTGNITRFVAYVTARGNNSALLETS